MSKEIQRRFEAARKRKTVALAKLSIVMAGAVTAAAWIIVLTW